MAQRHICKNIQVGNAVLPASEKEMNLAFDLNDFSWMDIVDVSDGAVFSPQGCSTISGLKMLNVCSVLWQNGFHALPDKEEAYSETFRVLKQGGCRSNRYVRLGCFIPPFEPEDSLKERLSGMYEEVQVTRVEGIGCFRCRKAQ